MSVGGSAVKGMEPSARLKGSNLCSKHKNYLKSKRLQSDDGVLGVIGCARALLQQDIVPEVMSGEHWASISAPCGRWHCWAHAWKPCCGYLAVVRGFGGSSLLLSLASCRHLNKPVGCWIKKSIVQVLFHVGTQGK